jgi:hypothetical protein
MSKVRTRARKSGPVLLKVAKAESNRDEGDERDDGNSRIFHRHSGHGMAVSRNPALFACHGITESEDGSSRTLNLRFNTMTTSPKILKLLALLTWITGGVVLFLKGYALFAEAESLRPGVALNFLPFIIAFTSGGLKARYLFLPACQKNLSRIDALNDPKPWQFFRAGFFVFMFTMITLGAMLSRWATGNYSALLTVSSVDLTLSVALLGSLGGFKQEPGARKPLDAGTR